jgi:hypothetical protein
MNTSLSFNRRENTAIWRSKPHIDAPVVETTPRTRSLGIDGDFSAQDVAVVFASPITFGVEVGHTFIALVRDTDAYADWRSACGLIPGILWWEVFVHVCVPRSRGERVAQSARSCISNAGMCSKAGALRRYPVTKSKLVATW